MRQLTIDLYAHFQKQRQPGQAGYLTCLLPDISEKIDPLRRFPAILIMPGGAYSEVSPREGDPIALRFTAAGYCAFVLQYSVKPIGYPAAFVEAAMAMAYIREQALSLHVDKQKIAAIGFSAGGHLCGCLATLFDAQILSEHLGEHARHARPNAAILCYPVISSDQAVAHSGSFDHICGSDDALRAYLSLEDRVTAHSVPAFIWHTAEDDHVLVENSLLMATAYARQRVPFSLHIFENGPHGLSCADETVYPQGGVPPVSTGLTSWLQMSLNWLHDRGICL